MYWSSRLTHGVGGWLYVSTHNLYFHTFLQFSDKTVIPFSQVKTVAKAKFAKILDNSILVTTKDGKPHKFTHFLSRDSVYNLMLGIIKSHLMNSLTSVT